MECISSMIIRSQTEQSLRGLKIQHWKKYCSPFRLAGTCILPGPEILYTSDKLKTTTLNGMTRKLKRSFMGCGLLFLFLILGQRGWAQTIRLDLHNTDL